MHSWPAPRRIRAVGGHTGPRGSARTAVTKWPRLRPLGRTSTRQASAPPAAMFWRRRDDRDRRYPHRPGRRAGPARCDHGVADAEWTLLVFNGIGASLETIAPFAERFRRTRIVTFDVPGIGGSPGPRLPYR